MTRLWQYRPVESSCSTRRVQDGETYVLKALLGLRFDIFLIEVLRCDCEHRSGAWERNVSGRKDSCSGEFRARMFNVGNVRRRVVSSLAHNQWFTMPRGPGQRRWTKPWRVMYVCLLKQLQCRSSFLPRLRSVRKEKKRNVTFKKERKKEQILIRKKEQLLIRGWASLVYELNLS